MWLMTKYGFCSIAEKRPGVFHIRAHERGDLEAMIVQDGPLPGERIHVDVDPDYEYRLIVNRVAVRRVMAWLAEAVDYPNFRQAVEQEPSQRHKPYHQIVVLLKDRLSYVSARLRN